MNSLKSITKSKRQLTASERIARLKRKTAEFAAKRKSFTPENVSDNDSNQANKSQIQNCSSKTLDRMFDTANDDDVVELIGSQTEKKGDSHHSDDSTSNVSSSKREVASESLTVVNLPSHEVADKNLDLVQLILQMQSQMTEMGHSLTILRKQISRVEVKSMQTCSCMGHSRSRMSNEFINEDILYDFEGELSREGLPLATCVEINEFEKKLRNDAYRAKIISLLIVINGESGDKKGEKIIKQIFDAIIDVEIKTQFTWTGKSAMGKTKLAFSEYKEIINLIYAVVRRADSQYTKSECEHDLTYRVLKYTGVKK